MDLIDGACNMMGLLNSLIVLQKELRENFKLSTYELNCHPVTCYFLQKIVDLSGNKIEIARFDSFSGDLLKWCNEYKDYLLKDEIRTIKGIKKV